MGLYAPLYLAMIAGDDSWGFEPVFSPHVPAGGFAFFLRFLSKSNIFMT